MNTLKRSLPFVLAVWLAVLTANLLAPNLFTATVEAAAETINCIKIGSGLTPAGKKCGSTVNISVDYNQVAAKNHNHFGQTWSGSGAHGLTVISSDGIGVLGSSTNNTGVYAISNANDGYAIIGSSGGSAGHGVYGYGDKNGVYGYSAGGAGVYGQSSAANQPGVYGYGTASNGRGLWGYSKTGYGVEGQSDPSGIAIYGYNPTHTVGWAGYFEGDINVTGSVVGPQAISLMGDLSDPSQTIYHAGVNSSELKNLYDGVAQLNDKGQAVVKLPGWFAKLNTEFRYQLTALGDAMPQIHVAREIESNQFTIAGGKPNGRVSWQVTGIRNDQYAQEHSFSVEGNPEQAQRLRMTRDIPNEPLAAPEPVELPNVGK